MKIRVAYDISVLASHFNRFDSKLGVTRVIEELLRELSKRDELDITAVGLCGEDPMFDSLRSGLYVNSVAGSIRCDFRPSFKSRLGLDGLYRRFFVPYLSGAEGAGVRSFFERGMRGALYRLSYTYGIDRFERVFDPAEYDVFHSTFPRLPPEELTGGVPRVLTIYDLIPVLAPQFVVPRITKDFERLLASINTRRDWIACISEHARGEFCDYTGMDAARVFVTPLAAAEHFRPVGDEELAASVRQRYGLGGREYFLSLAVPQPRKNLAHLIRCFYRLLEEQPSAASDKYLVLAGSKDQGWMYEEVFAALEESPRHRERVLFPGYVPDEDLSAVYGGALAFVYPSLHEGFGLPALEAMACGTAVIASDTTSLPEVVGEAGILVDPTDADALCDAMLKLMEDAALREELGRKGLGRAAEFSWERCAAQTAGVYRVAAGATDA